MTNKITFAEHILRFNNTLSQQLLSLPAGFKIINPFIGNQKEQVKQVSTAFYHKFYNDTLPRRMILGSSPARRGTAVTGVPFEDAQHLQAETGIYIDKFFINQASSGFLYDVMSKHGGCCQFYADFYMNFVCPLGIVKINSNGTEVNCNYYDNKELQKVLSPFIIDMLYQQLNFGIDTSVCYCIGSGKNYEFLSKVNDKYHFFDTIIPLEHPRFIMQYHSKDKDLFMKKYLDTLNHIEHERSN